MSTPSRTSPTSTVHASTNGDAVLDQIAANLDAALAGPNELTISSGSSTANSIVASAEVPLLAHAAGVALWVTWLLTNLGAMNITIDGLPTKDIIAATGSPLAAGDAPLGERCQIVYDGVAYRLFRSKDLGAAAVTDPILLLAFQTTAGTDGGTATAGSRQTYPLNTQLQNTIPSAIFDAGTSRITVLPIGTYDVNAAANFSVTNACGIFLHNDTTGADVPNLGLSRGYGGNVDHALLSGRFSLAAASIIKLQYFVQTTKATTGLGNGVSSADPGGTPNSFGYLNLRKIA